LHPPIEIRVRGFEFEFGIHILNTNTAQWIFVRRVI
jgi:hypothetical protein